MDDKRMKHLLQLAKEGGPLDLCKVATRNEIDLINDEELVVFTKQQGVLVDTTAADPITGEYCGAKTPTVTVHGLTSKGEDRLRELMQVDCR